MALIDRFARFLLVIGMPLALVLAPMYLFVTPGFVRHEYAQRGFPASIRFDPSERLAISDAAVAYLRGRIGREDLAAVRTASGEIALNTREIDHLVDVRVVMEALFLAQRVAAGAVAVPGVYLWRRGQRYGLSRGLRHGVIATGALIAGTVGYAVLDFDAFFTAFHGLFFREGTWTFSYTDTLIQLYPLPLWMDAVWKIGAVVALEMVIVYALGALRGRQRAAAPVPGDAQAP